MPDYGLGRRFAPDPRDKRFPMRALAPARSDRTSRHWYQNGWWGDQGSTPMCVGFSWAHWIEDAPITHPDPEKSAWIKPEAIYNEAQLVDPWPGTGYDGTTVRAGAEALRLRSVIAEYRWAWDVQTLIMTLLEVGPVVVGTNWYDSMFTPDDDHMLVITETAQIAGGHAWVLNGVNVVKQQFRMKNSWSREWGHKGNALISFDTMQRLLNEDGEAAIALEVKL